jgi:hypothetical protein
LNHWQGIVRKCTVNLKFYSCQLFAALASSAMKPHVSVIAWPRGERSPSEAVKQNSYLRYARFYRTSLACMY